MSGTWTTLTNAPPADVCTTFLLTDGSVLAQGVSTNQWYRLRPDTNGNYANGTWTTMASSVNGPLYYAAGILRDGRLIIAGGEYNFGSMVWLNAAEMYNPVTNAWTTLPTPAGWTKIGDAPGCVLPDGRFIVGEVTQLKTAIYDPIANAWTASANKIAKVGEESWSLLPDGSIHAVDCSSPPNAEKYIIAADKWVPAGKTPQVLVDSISEIGASVLLPDGRVFVIGATGFTALYTFPAIANQPGTWATGPTIPPVNPGQALGTVDAPAALLPNGRVLFTAGPITIPATFQTPTYCFEFDPATNTIAPVAVPDPLLSNGDPYFGRMLMLPTGQVFYTQGKTMTQVYTPGGTYDPVWRPTITTCPASLQKGKSYTLFGRQINGLSQCIYYGNDATQATNYPIVRLEEIGGPKVIYCRTFNFSTMGLQTGTVVHNCRFTVPNSTPVGCYRLVVIANGIPSKPRKVCVSSKIFKELKIELKEVSESVKILKQIVDGQKQVPDFIDPKLIREELELFGAQQEQWLDSVRTFATSVDEVTSELGRAFIRAEERPELLDLADEAERGEEVERIMPRRLNAEQTRLGQKKKAYNDGREEEELNDRQEEIRAEIHNLSRDGKDFDLQDDSHDSNDEKKQSNKEQTNE